MSKKHALLVQKNFNTNYGEYDQFVKKVAPGYAQLQKKLVALVKAPKFSALQILDLGIGTGKTAELLLKKYPSMKITGYDISDTMLAKGKSRLRRYKRVKFYKKNMLSLTSTNKYDFIISAMAIHHLENKDKKKLYLNVFQALKKGGLFINCDRVLQESVSKERQVLREWKKFATKHLGRKEMLKKFAMFQEEDLPEKVSLQLEWLKKIGFKEVKENWRYNIYSLFSGRKK